MLNGKVDLCDPSENKRQRNDAQPHLSTISKYHRHALRLKSGNMTLQRLMDVTHPLIECMTLNSKEERQVAAAASGRQKDDSKWILSKDAVSLSGLVRLKMHYLCD